MKLKWLVSLCALTLSLASVPLVHAGDKAKTSEGAEIDKTNLVATGTYKGTAHKVDPGEKEIYVKTDDGKILELYLKENTEIMKGSEKAEFSELKEGQKLEVNVENKDGKKLHPVSVKIVE